MISPSSLPLEVQSGLDITWFELTPLKKKKKKKRKEKKKKKKDLNNSPDLT